MILEKITEDLKEAMKLKDEAKVSTLRMILSSLKNKKIELMHDLSEDESMAILRTLVKQYKDSIEDFKRGSRDDLAEKTLNEVRMIEAYLPQGPSEEMIRQVVEKKIGETGSVGVGDFGKVMGLVMKEFGGAASGDVVSKIVKEILH